jgi:hypothetical protein
VTAPAAAARPAAAVAEPAQLACSIEAMRNGGECEACQ